MNRMRIEADSNALGKAERLLAGIPNGFQRAMISSFNRALLEGRTAGTREATQHYTAKAYIVRRTVVMHRAGKNNIEADLSSRGRNLQLELFTHKPTTDTTGARRRQVTVAVKKEPLKPIGQGFIYRGMVMQRLGASRLPVKHLYSVSVPNILDNEKVRDKILDTMEKSVDKRLEHETYRLLNGYEGESKYYKGF